MTAFNANTRQKVRQRADGRCDLCSLPVAVAHYHHRRPRGMGGTVRADSGDASNCLFLHPRCHEQVESNRERAIANGWLVPQYQDPQKVPAKLWMGLVVLGSDGTATPVG